MLTIEAIDQKGLGRALAINSQPAALSRYIFQHDRTQLQNDIYINSNQFNVLINRTQN